MILISETTPLGHITKFCDQFFDAADKNAMIEDILLHGICSLFCLVMMAITAYMQVVTSKIVHDLTGGNSWVVTLHDCVYGFLQIGFSIMIFVQVLQLAGNRIKEFIKWAKKFPAEVS